MRLRPTQLIDRHAARFVFTAAREALAAGAEAVRRMTGVMADR